MPHQQEAGAGESLGGELPGVRTVAVEHQRGTAVLCVVLVYQAQHTDGAVSIAHPPLLRPGRIECQEADPQDPPDVDDRFRFLQRKAEQRRIAVEGCRRQTAIERGGPQHLLRRPAVGLVHVRQLQPGDRLAACLPARRPTVAQQEL